MTRRRLAAFVSILSLTLMIISWNFLGVYLQISTMKRNFITAVVCEGDRAFPNPSQQHNSTTLRVLVSYTPSFNRTSSPANTSSHSNRTLFVSTNGFFGRLGNRMFTYATLLGVAVANGRQLILPLDEYLSKTFKLQRAIFNSTKLQFRLVNERPAISFDERLMHLPDHDVKIGGLTQSFKYFLHINDVIRKEFIFLDSVANEATIILDNIRIQHIGSLMVGVHVRRTDFLIEKWQKVGYGVPQSSYFLKAFDWFRSKFPGRNVTFVVVSDDLPWCKANLTGSDVVVVPPASMSVHMAVIAGCDHAIISGGTFGWWCGWFAGGYVIHYSGFMPENTFLGNITTNEDYYLPLWISMGN